MDTASARLTRLALAAAAVAAACAFVFPLYNPDLYWHLSAGRRILELRAVPATDWLSSSRAGAPWRDFEWLSELLYYAVQRAAGAAGLLALKAALVAALLSLGAAALRLYELSQAAEAAALCVLAAALVPFSDLRPDLFSAAGFAFLFWRLEARRLGRGPALGAPACAVLFALWANLHAGYPYGLALLGLYALAAPGGRRAELWAALAAGAAGCCLQPGGPAAFEVLWRHWRDMSGLSALILEWAAPSWSNSWHWPFFACAGGAAAAFLALLASRRRPAAAPAAAVVLFGVLAARHVRLALFFDLLAVPAAAGWLAQSARADARVRAFARRAAGALAALSCAYTLFLAARARAFTRLVRPVMAPQAAQFLLDQRAVLGGRAVYSHAWGWGGYLGWRLYPAYRVFADGRYIFDAEMLESRRAQAGPANWADFLAREKLDVVLLERSGPYLPTTRVYPDGTSRPIARPYWAVFMPRERWALVEWDEQALLFVRRASVPAAWLAAHEYRLARPGDEPALSDALARGEVRRAALAAELARHAAEDRALLSRASDAL